MCERLKTASLKEVGRPYGITGERVRQLTGGPGTMIGRHFAKKARKQQRLDRVPELVAAGLSNKQIAVELGVKTHTVSSYRTEAGVTRQKKHSPEHSLWCLHKWVELFGYVPAATDWITSQARNLGHTRRAQRSEEFRAKYGCPWFEDLMRQFGSWANFIEAGGYPRPSLGARKLPWREAPLLSELEELPD